MSTVTKMFFSPKNSPTEWALNKAIAFTEKKQHLKAFAMKGAAAGLLFANFVPLIKIPIAGFAVTAGQIPAIKRRTWTKLENLNLVNNSVPKTLLDLVIHVYKCVMSLIVFPFLLIGGLVGLPPTSCRAALAAIDLVPKKIEKQEKVPEIPAPRLKIPEIKVIQNPVNNILPIPKNSTVNTTSVVPVKNLTPPVVPSNPVSSKTENPSKEIPQPKPIVISQPAVKKSTYIVRLKDEDDEPQTKKPSVIEEKNQETQTPQNQEPLKEEIKNTNNSKTSNPSQDRGPSQNQTGTENLAEPDKKNDLKIEALLSPTRKRNPKIKDLLNMTSVEQLEMQQSLLLRGGKANAMTIRKADVDKMYEQLEKMKASKKLQSEASQSQSEVPEPPPEPIEEIEYTPPPVATESRKDLLNEIRNANGVDSLRNRKKRHVPQKPEKPQEDEKKPPVRTSSVAKMLKMAQDAAEAEVNNGNEEW